jgi:hypothetical protein
MPPERAGLRNPQHTDVSVTNLLASSRSPSLTQLAAPDSFRSVGGFVCPGRPLAGSSRSRWARCLLFANRQRAAGVRTPKSSTPDDL